MLKNLGALRRAEAERCSTHCVGEHGTDKNDDRPEETAMTVAEYQHLAGLRLTELEAWRQPGTILPVLSVARTNAGTHARTYARIHPHTLAHVSAHLL